MSAFIIFPNQLFEDMNHLKHYDTIFVVEESIYFFDSVYKPFKPSKIKLAFLRACMRSYYDTLCKTLGTSKVKYIDYTKTKSYDFTRGFSEVVFFHPSDHDLIKKMTDLGIIEKSRILDTPNFFMSTEGLQTYHKTHTRSSRHSSFFDFVKQELNILTNVESYDKYNRNALPSNIKIPNVNYNPSKEERHYYDEAITYVEKLFHDHAGDAQYVQMYPISSKYAYKQFQKFLSMKFHMFGEYQDAIKQSESILFHSNMSSALNVGLLDPRRIIKLTLEYAEKHDIHMNNVEGFVRQLLGWREYMRYLYIFHYEDMIKSNAPSNTTYFKSNDAWYEGKTGILPLDEEIKKAVKTGYAHHIVRLMVFMNFFILCEIHPHQMYKWFMEVVCIDAYSWVMIPNIYAMGYFYKQAMRKPYISTSNYILKMSDYKKNGSWENIWDGLFFRFVSKKPKDYVSFYLRNMKKSRHIQEADKFIKDYVSK